MSIQVEDLEGMAVALAVRYPKKKDRQAAAKDALYADPFGPDAERVALALLGSHPDRVEKVGCGVERIKTRPAAHGTRCFYVVRQDGSGTDFSYLKCLTAPTSRQNVHAACRWAIGRQIEAFRWERLGAGDPRCDLTGAPVSAINSHVHHAPPMFDVLVDGWARLRGGYDAIDARLERGDNVQGVHLQDADLQGWESFHADTARLQLVHSIANQSIEAARRRIKAEECP